MKQQDYQGERLNPPPEENRDDVATWAELAAADDPPAQP